MTRPTPRLTATRASLARTVQYTDFTRFSRGSGFRGSGFRGTPGSVHVVAVARARVDVSAPDPYLQRMPPRLGAGGERQHILVVQFVEDVLGQDAELRRAEALAGEAAGPAGEVPTR